MRAHEVFLQNRGDITREYYRSLTALGPRGEFAVALMRVLKRSKHRYGVGYRTVPGRRKREQYDNADAYEWAINELLRLLMAFSPSTLCRWGWAEGKLYIDLDGLISKQVRFDCPDRGPAHYYEAPRCASEDPDNCPCEAHKQSVDLRVIQFCESVTMEAAVQSSGRVIRKKT